MRPTDRAKKIAERCQDAYSADAYGSWAMVAQVLIGEGLRDNEVEAVMRSKWTRWAIDGWSRVADVNYGHVPARAVKRFVDGQTERMGRMGMMAEVKRLTEESGL